LSDPLREADHQHEIPVNARGQSKTAKWNGAAMLLSVEKMYEAWLEITLIHSCCIVT